MKVSNYDAVMDSYERRLKRIIEQTGDRFCEQAERLRAEMQVLDKQIKFNIDDSIYEAAWKECEDTNGKHYVCTECGHWTRNRRSFCLTCNRKMRNADEDFSR